MGDKDDLLDHFFSAAYHDDFVEHQQQYYQHQPLNESGNQEYRPMKSSNSSRKTLNRTNSSTMNNTKKSTVTINRASSSVKTLTTNPAKSKAKSAKKKKKRLMKQDEAITKRLIEKWKENDVDDEGLKILFNQVDVAFPQYVPEDSGHKFRSSGNVKGNSPPRIPDSNALRNHTRNSSTLSKGNNMTNSKEMFVGNPKTTDMKTDDVVRWIDLRDNYLTQLRTLFSSLNDEDLDDTIQKKSVTLLMLLAALRKISIRIVSTFEIVCLQYNNKRIKTKVDTKMLIEMTDYIRGMASSLDWMGAYNEICQSFLHINPILNPFLSIQRIDGLSALYGNESHGNSKKNLMRLAEIGNIPFELTLSEDELEHCAHLGYIIYTLHNNNTTKTVQEMKNESKMFEDFTKPRQTDFLYRDPYEMQNNLTDQNNSNINNLKDDVTNTVIEKDLFDEMSSPTYFLNNEVDESVLHKPNRIENEQENPTINYFSEQFNEKRNLDKQRMYHGNSSPPPEDVATVDVRFATTDMNGHARNGPSNVVLHSNVTKFHTNETPGMRKLSGCKPDALSLHQVHATNPTEEDGVAVRRLGNRVSAFGNNFEKDDDVVAVHVIDMYKLRFAWKYWRREFLGIEKIKPFIAYREKKIKQKIFHRLQLCLWQNFVYRSLVLRYEMRLKQHVFRNGLVKYHYWCRDLKIFYKSRLRKIVQKYFYLLCKWTKNNYANRKFVRNKRYRYISNCFRLLRSNVILNKHLLQSKLRHSSNLLFCDFFMRQVCFCKWNRFRLYSKQLDTVEELVENIHLKDALVKWSLLTWPPKPKLTMREQVNALRQSIDNKIAMVKGGAGTAGNALRNSIQKHCVDKVPDIRPQITRLLEGLVSNKSNNKNTVHPVLNSPMSEREARRRQRIANAAKYSKQKTIKVDEVEPTGVDVFPPTISNE